MSELYRDFIEDQFDRVVNAINNELPTPTSTDIGKFVGVVSDGGAGAEYSLENVPNELPTPTTSDIDKVVKVVSDGGTGAEYALDSVPNELPTPTTSDIDKVVKVISDGSGGAEYSLDTPAGGLPAVVTNADEYKCIQVARSGTWQKDYFYPMTVVATFYGTLSVTFYGGYVSRSNFVTIQTPKYASITGMASDYSYRYSGVIPCIGSWENKKAIFKGIVFNNNNNTTYEATLIIDANSSSGDSLTVTPI